MRDNAPIGNTCPIIDNIISKMEYAKGEAEYIIKHQDEDVMREANTILSELTDAILDMENIRSDNQSLREWGNDEYNRAEDLEKERDELLTKVELLEEENENLKLQLNEY